MNESAHWISVKYTQVAEWRIFYPIWMLWQHNTQAKPTESLAVP